MEAYAYIYIYAYKTQNNTFILSVFINTHFTCIFSSFLWRSCQITKKLCNHAGKLKFLSYYQQNINFTVGF